MNQIKRISHEFQFDSTPNFRTPLALASKEGQDEVVEILIKYGAEIESIDESGR